jgi:hypothetical protein
MVRTRNVLILGLIVAGACGPHPATSTTPTAATGAETPPPQTGSRPNIADAANERIGDIATGMAGADVIAKLGAPASKTPPVEEGATGAIVSTWTWPALGLALHMTGATAADAPTVGSITLSAPSRLTTSRGIGIGAGRAEVERIYAASLAKGREPGEADPSTPAQLIIGSIYGGTFFHFENGKVTEIFVGAGAE